MSIIGYIIGGYYSAVAITVGYLMYDNYNGVFYDKKKAIVDIEMDKIK